MEASGRPIAVENCGNTHGPTQTPDPSWPHGECPYNWFRSSTDINPSWASIMNNLASTTPYQELVNPRSRPSCWAYPDSQSPAVIPWYAMTLGKGADWFALQCWRLETWPH